MTSKNGEPTKDWTIYQFNELAFKSALNKLTPKGCCVPAYSIEARMRWGCAISSVDCSALYGNLFQYKKRPFLSTGWREDTFTIPFCGLMRNVKHCNYSDVPHREQCDFKGPQHLFYPVFRKDPYSLNIKTEEPTSHSRETSLNTYIIAVAALRANAIEPREFPRDIKQLEALLREEFDGYDIPEFGSVAEVPPLQRTMPRHLANAFKEAGLKKYKIHGYKPESVIDIYNACLIFDKRKKEYRVTRWDREKANPSNMVHRIEAGKGQFDGQAQAATKELDRVYL